MSVEYSLVVLYLLGCIGLGVYASKRGLSSKSEYWVAGRSIGVTANAMAIMASLASGGSIVGVMGLAYKYGLPYTLSLFAGAIVGFPLAAVLVAAPLRRFAKFTLPDFLSHRYPHPVVRVLVPVLIVASFSVYMVAQMKAAGITAEVLLGMDYQTAVTVAALVFILYVSIGGMLAVTWTDIMQGCLMLSVVLGTAAALTAKSGSPLHILHEATRAAPALGSMEGHSMSAILGVFVLWAVSVPVIPHIVMRVFTAKDARGAKVSLNLAMILYSVMIISAVFVVVPVGKLLFPQLADADKVFLEVVQSQFPPMVRGLAVAAVMAAVMSTTAGLLLACSASVTHDLLGRWVEGSSHARRKALTVAVTWIIGLAAMFSAYDPPKLITLFYSAAVGLLGASMFVPLVAGIWWKRANTLGGVLSLVLGAVVYLGLYLAAKLWGAVPGMAAILFALPASLAGMAAGAFLGRPVSDRVLRSIEALHRP